MVWYVRPGHGFALSLRCDGCRHPVRALRTYKTQEDGQRLADLFERTPWAVEALHQAYPPASVGVQSVGFWETARASDPAVRMPHTQQNDTEMERDERQSQ
jgi:hypothetical protein